MLFCCPGLLPFSLSITQPRKAIILSVILLIYLKPYSQQPEQILNQWVARNPIEKIYFHFDRSDYIAGQTIWLKGYVYADFLPASKSSDLFIELFNSSSILVSRQVLPLFGGFAYGRDSC